jgi:HSP20 family protein
VRENKFACVFKADLPGVKQDDLEVSITGNRLQISGKRDEEKEAKDDTFYTYERSYGSFSRTFTLPDTADAEHVKTELQDGVLSLVVPKKPEAQAKKIPISIGASKS